MTGTARVTIIVLLLLAVPWLAPASGEAQDVPAFVVAFRELPQDAAVGGTYAGGKILHMDATLRFLSVKPSDPEEFAAAVRADDRVRYIEPDMPVHALFSPNDPRYVSGEQYGPQRIGAPLAWDKTLGATSAHVCITDTGVRRAHEDIDNARYLGGNDLIEGDTEPNDPHGHGTLTTALAVAATNNGKGIAGMAQVSWSHARVLGPTGSGSSSIVASGIRWCADFGAHVISASLGASGTSSVHNDAVTYAWNAGAVFVAGSGNDGCTPCVYTPANAPLAIAVGCTNSVDARCSISNGGPQLDIVAPGEDIVGPWSGSNTHYVTGTGTSASTPLVAGTAALVKSFSPAIDNVKIRERLEGTALDLGGAGWDSAFGHGRVRTDKSLLNAAPAIVSMDCTPATAATSKNVTCAIVTQDVDAHGVAAELDWGDGSTSRVPATGYAPAGTTILAVHRYAASGSPTIAAFLRDDAPDPLASSTISRVVSIVPNDAPGVPSISCAPVPSAAGQDVTCTFSAADDSDGVAFEIDWGDGTTGRAPAVGFAAPGASVTADHAFLDAGYYDVTARAVDDAAPARAGPHAFGIQEVRVCSFFASGSILLGAAGAQVDGVSKRRVEGIPPGCGLIGYSLTSTGTAADVDVCWLRDGLILRCDINAGGEAGTVPDGADAADVILARGAQAGFVLSIPGSPDALDILARIQDDDGEMDRTLALDFTDDAAIKDLVVTSEQLAELPGRATLQVYGRAYNCASTVSMLFSINDVPFTRFSPCSVFPTDDFGWASLNVPTRLLVTGITNRFEIQKLPTAGFETDSLRFGLDTDAATDRTVANQNGLDLPGELMWRLVLER